MKTVFIALVLLFNASNGKLEDAGVSSAYETSEQCELLVAHMKAKAEGDMSTIVFTECVEVPIAAAPKK